ncbi:MAG: hypothetical protein DCC49_01235 [Acidobacteria bacterium]|nr:MAG: hypothetical protein DCC49_01235 [Acidobacteriota bacterium]
MPIGSPSAFAVNEATCDCWQRIRPPDWTGDFPVSHSAPAAAWDAKRNKMVKFGGKGWIGTSLDSTWEWDGLNWTQLAPPTTPPSRYGAAMGFDHKRGVIVMFGGYKETGFFPLQFDTWEYDGTDWYMPPSGNLPGLGGTATDTPAAALLGLGTYAGQFQGSLVWDADREELVLIGGTTADMLTSMYAPFPETWSYSGGQWTKRSPATVPPPRTRPALMADPARSQIVMWGGSTKVPPSGADTTETMATVNSMITDTWVWNGSNWGQVVTSHTPDPRLQAFGGDGNQNTPPQLFGGQSATGQDVDEDGELELLLGTLDDLWTWTGSDWQRQLTNSEVVDRKGSAGRNEHAMAYDTLREQAVIFGGYSLGGVDESTATWTWQPPFGNPMLARQYFAEGYTGGMYPFDEYMTVLNQSPDAGTVRFRFLTDGGGIVDRDYAIAGQSRFTLKVNDVLGSGVSHGTIVFSDRPVYTERPMYFNYAGNQGGHVDPGAQDLFKQFYFPEGYIGPGFDSYFTMLNPNAFPVTVDISYLLAGGGTQVKTHTIGANARLTVNVRNEGIATAEFGARIQARDGFIHVEQPIYFNYMSGIRDGSVNKGQVMLSETAEFAEGYTGAGFAEYLTLINPNPAPATVAITYMTETAPTKTTPHVIPANGRYTVHVNADLGFGRSHSTRIVADQPIAAARPMYFDYGGPNGWTGGTVGIGFSASQWALLPEGFVNNGTFDTFVTLGNPHDTPTEVTATYVFPSGWNVIDVLTIPANGRLTRKVNDVVASPQPFSVFVITTDPSKSVLVERPMYFNYNGWPGGSASAGFNASPYPRYYP